MNKNGKGFAYVFYATDDRYAVSALVAVWQLKKLKAPEGIKFVLLHLNLAEKILSAFRRLNVVLIQCKPLPYISCNYYRHCLIKLNVLSLTQYERVLFLDADAMPMQTMAELFTLEFEEEIAAPRCWWLKRGVTSILLVVKPSAHLLSRVSKYFPAANRHGFFDMDIINEEFVYRNDHLHLLHPRYGCLNSVWERREGACFFGDQDLCIGEMKFIHYTALGKPWNCPPQRSMQERPDAHPYFHELFRLWWKRLDEVAKLVQLSPDITEDRLRFDEADAVVFKPLRHSFTELMKIRQDPAVARLCRKVRELKQDSRARTKAPGVRIQTAAPVQSDITAGRQAIPKIIHQTWKDRKVPQALSGYCDTWRKAHPDWEYRLWTDADNREFLARHYAWFLPVFDNYPSPIMRADAVRYFILFHFGGVYADLDMECCRSVSPLLAGRPLVLGLEPDAHLSTPLARERSLTRIIGNALMASVPGHPFWETVFKALVGAHRDPGPLDATGPFMLTRAWEACKDKTGIFMEPPHRFYPIDNETALAGLQEPDRKRIRRSAFTIHHWMGSWWRKKEASDLRKLTLMSRGSIIDMSLVNTDNFRRMSRGMGPGPMVSCLMVTRDRPVLARRAVACFRNQTWDNRELVILDDGPDTGLADWIHGLSDDRICFYPLPDSGQPLGTLRNLAVKKARGAYVAQWDDDDLSHPARLEIQMAMLRVLKTHACFLERHRIWWPDEGRMALSTKRIWEGSFVCLRENLPAYPDLEKGEDTPVVKRITADHRIAVLDHPRLYTYIFHGKNTFGAGHWEEHWRAATRTFKGEAYTAELAALESDCPVNLTDHDPVPPAGRKENVPQTPRVLILIPVKDAAPYLPRLWENLNTLTFSREHLSLAFLESDSRDNTFAAIERELPDLNRRFARARLFKHDFGYRPDLPRWDGRIQYRRRSILAKSRNTLLARALGNEDWVLWLDADVCRIPPDLIRQLLAADKQIVVPNCLCDGTGDPFDLNTFRFKPGARDSDRYLKDGIYQPPKGSGRYYLTDLKDRSCVRVDGVGGTALMIRADLHREGLNFPSFSYKGYIETEGLAMMARDMGLSCWGLPHLEIFHP